MERYIFTNGCAFDGLLKYVPRLKFDFLWRCLDRFIIYVEILYYVMELLALYCISFLCCILQACSSCSVPR
jgi:hypothetical protein